MTDPDQKQSSEKPVDKSVVAYEELLRRTRENLGAATDESPPRFREMLERARDSMVELGELTREEANKVSDYLRRDVEDAASYIAETGQDIHDWWRFDLQLIEQRMLDMFSLVADQTSLQLAQWAETARRLTLYQAGEITGPGTLVCDRCGAKTHFIKAGRIPPCADCNGIAFKRQEQSTDNAAGG